jgi:hypothetical protein
VSDGKLYRFFKTRHRIGKNGQLAVEKICGRSDVANSKSTSAFWTELTSICSIKSDFVRQLNRCSRRKMEQMLRDLMPAAYRSRLAVIVIDVSGQV